MENKVISDLEIVLENYQKEFGELPQLPIMASYDLIYNEMKDAIVRGNPLSAEEVNEIISSLNIPMDNVQ